MGLRDIHRRKVIRIPLGFTLLIVGAVLSIPGVPGPGLAIIALGLWILSDHFTWAKRALDWIKSKTPRILRRKDDQADPS